MTQIELETAKLEQIAAEYRQKGYDVSIRPASAAVPQFLAPFQPDLIVRSENDNAVIEVKSSNDLTSGSLAQLAAKIESRPGWRLELAVVNQPFAQEVPRYGVLVTEDRVDHILRQAQLLSREKSYEPAALMAWAAAEAILRRMAVASGVEVEKKSTGSVLKLLYALGLIDADQYDNFSRAMEFRNAFAHGFEASLQPESIDRVIHDVESLRSRPAA
ncbi:MAG TPA: hypothetical protein VGQ65_19120 [Thermoanaerobaculia bacterium]|jgi:uncharacterized protein YutE (UPF0331/DUF86 family)|nr:hypothetical protein [Thermoanaerobaculia bacterium]